MSYQFYYNQLVKDLSRDESDHRNKWAKETIAHVKYEMSRSRITVDSDGVVRNCIGSCLMDDLLAVAVYVDPSISVKNTQRVRNIEDEAFLSEYRKMRATKGYSDEERAEIANEFGNSTVVDVLTGRSIH